MMDTYLIRVLLRNRDPEGVVKWLKRYVKKGRIERGEMEMALYLQDADGTLGSAAERRANQGGEDSGP